MLHPELIEAAAAAGKDIFCEKPVGGTPEQTTRAARAARDAGVDHRRRLQLPLGAARAPRASADRRRPARRDHQLPRPLLLDLRERPAGPLSWRYRLDEAGHGATTDLLSHAVDLAHDAARPDHARRGDDRDVHPRAPPARPPARTTAAAAPTTHARHVTNEDYAGMLCEFASGARGIVRGEPDDRRAREPDGVRGPRHAGRAELEPRAAQRAAGLPRRGRLHSGYRTVFGGDRFPYHGNFVPGSANGIGFEDLVVIEDLAFLRSVPARRPHEPGFEQRWRSATSRPRCWRRPAAGAGRRSRDRHRRRPRCASASSASAGSAACTPTCSAARCPAPRSPASTTRSTPPRRPRGPRTRPPSTASTSCSRRPTRSRICSSTETHADLIVAAARGRQGDLLREARLARPRRGRPRAGRRVDARRSRSRSASTAASTPAHAAVREAVAARRGRRRRTSSASPAATPSRRRPATCAAPAGCSWT